MARKRVWLYVTGPALGLMAILWVTLALAGSNGEDQGESPMLREAPNIPVASVSQGVVAVGTQDNTIWT